MAALYEIASEYKQALVELNNMDLDDQTIADTLEGLSGDMEAKGRSVAAFFQNLDSEAAAIKDAVQRMSARQKVIQNRSARLRQYLLDNMQRCEITEISCPEFAIKVVKNPPSVIVDDVYAIPSDYTKEKVTVTVDKTLIKTAIKDGHDVPGAHTETGYRLKIT